MKRIALILSAALFVLAAVSCKNAKTAESAADGEAAKEGPAAGAIVYFNLDRVLEEYDMANDLRSAVETKVNSIQQEINRRGTQKLQQQQNSFQQYAAQKQQEMAEEQQVMLNQIGDAIKTFLDEFNAEKQYAMILSTQGGVLPAPVAAADSELDITDAILEGLNAAYVKTKAKETK